MEFNQKSKYLLEVTLLLFQERTDDVNRHGEDGS